MERILWTIFESIYFFNKAIRDADFINNFNSFNFFQSTKKELILSLMIIKNISFSISILPIILVFIISMFTGAKIRTMWMSTFYLFFGLFIFYFSTNKIKMKKILNFFYIFGFIFCYHQQHISIFLSQMI